VHVTRPGARIDYRVWGSGEPDVFLCPPCYPIIHSRLYKLQIPYLGRHFRVITMDFRGNGRSDRPPAGYDFDTLHGDVEAVLAATARTPLVFVATSCGSLHAIRYAVEHPERVARLVLISPQYAQPVPEPFEERFAAVVRRDFDGYVDRFWRASYPEPHSLKGIEDAVAWAHETTPEVLIEAFRELGRDDVRDLLPRIQVPTLLLHGTRDRIVPYKVAAEMAAAIPGARLVTFEGGGHALAAREAATVNRLIRDFAQPEPVVACPAHVPARPDRVVPPRPARQARRILWLSSPIGLGHIQRDLAIVRALRARYPDVSVDFLAANPAERVVQHAGERVHPATRLLLNESGHFEAWAADHELHAFNALWDMDEILAANFMVFADVVERTRYDLWVGDEGWDLDYYLHENPELKTAPYVFLTDFIGMLPMRDDPTSTEFARTWEKNAETIDHLRLHPDVRDLSILVGDAEDVLDREFGPGLPNMRAWAREHFRFPGYTHHFDPAAWRDRARLRAEAGFRDDERVILVSVGGTRVGHRLLRRCAEAFALIAPRLPDTRMILVGGPRLGDADLPRGARLETRAFVPDLFRLQAAADLAIVQGGLTTTMELAALRTPFLYFPLRHHFEQQLHVTRRLERLGAGVRMDYDRTSAEALGAAILEHLGKPVHWPDVPADGTARAAALLATLLA
jgi:pimeloyl-ACP methyl ester carboxylesterase/predicted glycosyltransferase